MPSAGPLPGAGGWSVAVQHLGLVLVPGRGGPVGVDDQGPAPAVDDDLVVEGAQQDAVLARRSCRRGPCAVVWCTWQAPAGWVQPPAHWQCRSRSSTALRIPAGTVSAYPMSSGRLGPPSRTPSCRRRRKLASPPGPGQQVDGLADHRLLERRPRPRWCRAAGLPSRRSRSSSTHSRTRSSSASTLMSPVTTGAIAASHAIGRGGVPVQPGAVVRAGLGGVRAARGPPRPHLLGPLVLQGGVGVEQQQVGQGDVRPGLDRLPGPLRQQPAGGQPPHAVAVILRHA